jgi:hypothetical protein
MLRLFRDAHYEEIVVGLVAVLNIMYVEPYENQDSQRKLSAVGPLAPSFRREKIGSCLNNFL